MSMRRSVITSFAPREARNRAAATPLTPSPTTITRLFDEFHQRSFSVLSATSAHTIDTIQNLITTTVSGIPLSSK